MTDLKNKVALITGSGRGIGADAAQETVNVIERIGGKAIEVQADVSKVADLERLFVGSSTTAFPMPGHGFYCGSKMAPRFLIEVLAKEIGHRGVTVNSILPTATQGAGRHAEPKPEIAQFIKNFMPMNRIGTVEDTANAAECHASDLARFVSGRHLLLSGGGPVSGSPTLLTFPALVFQHINDPPTLNRLFFISKIPLPSRARLWPKTNITVIQNTRGRLTGLAASACHSNYPGNGRFQRPDQCKQFAFAQTMPEAIPCLSYTRFAGLGGC